MTVLKTLWKFTKPNETMLVMLGVFVVLSLLTAVALYRGKGEQFNSELQYEIANSAGTRQTPNFADGAAAAGESDEGLRYAERVKEASSIGLGLSLYLIRERVSARRRILTLDELMKEFSQSDILPPAVRVLFPNSPANYGIMQTGRGIYYIRYQASPLKIEVLSTGAGGTAADAAATGGDAGADSPGATFILRVPDTAAGESAPVAGSNRTSSKIKSAGAWATIYEAPENTNHYIPPPFAPETTFAAMNWKIRSLLAAELSAERLKEINDFLARQQ